MFKKTRSVLAAATFDLHRSLLILTIWSCHVFVAPAVRLCQGLRAAVIALKGPNNLSLRRVKRRCNLNKKEVVTPPGLAMTSQESDCVYINPSKLLQLRSRASRIASIPRIWGHGVKQPMGQAETPNPELRTPNFKGFTLIEVIAAMIVVGILAATLLPRIDFGATSSRVSADGAVYMIASDIRYAQEFAMANWVSKEIRFTSGSNSYSFFPTSGLDPTGQLPSGVTTGTTVTFTFNSLGEPTTSAGWTVTVPGSAKTITVTNYTGKVSY